MAEVNPESQGLFNHADANPAGPPLDPATASTGPDNAAAPRPRACRSFLAMLFSAPTSRPSAAALAVCLAALLSVGCTARPAARASHAPTYSYVHDPLAAAEVASWPQMQASAPVQQVAAGPE